MTTIHIRDFTTRCKTTEGCRHHICPHCGQALRSRKQNIADHPDTIQVFAAGLCEKGWLDNPPLNASDLQDNRHELLTDRELDRIWHQDGDHWEWLMQRRIRLGLGQFKEAA